MPNGETPAPLDGNGEHCHSWAEIFSDTAATIRLAIFVILLAVVIVVIVVVVENLTRSQVDKLTGRLTVEQGSSGLSISYTTNDTESVILSVPASELWFDSNLALAPGETVVVRAAGRVHLSIVRLVDSARCTSSQSYRWVGPEGYDEPTSLAGDEKRHALLLDPDSKFGVLLAFLQSGTDPTPDRDHPRVPHDRIIRVGPERVFTNTSKENAHLWLAVNDQVLSNTPEARKAFVLTQNELDRRYNHTDDCGNKFARRTVKIQEGLFDKLVAAHYWAVWYDDNIGTYQVAVQRRKPKK